MGNGIAHVFAVAGDEVYLFDSFPGAIEKAFAKIDGNMDRQIKKGTLTAENKVAALKRIWLGRTMEEAVGNADLVIEAVIEKEEAKKELLARVDAIAPKSCILASNTSSISITRLAAGTSRPGHVIGMHFMNPVPVMPLVEIIRGQDTTNTTYKIIEEATKRLGKTPVVVNDYPGFVSNRVLMPMINEAIYCVFEGVAEPEAIDQVMKLGMNHPMGPLQLADFIGLDVCLNILQVLQDGLGDPKYRPCPLLKRKVAAGHLGVKSGKGFFEYEKK